MTYGKDDLASLEAARQSIEQFERSLDATRRKALGQFFSGLPLGRLLAALSVTNETKSIIDPMAGDGDLIDAALERSTICGRAPDRVDAIDVDELTSRACSVRLEPWTRALHKTKFAIHSGSAFNESILQRTSPEGYGLVITNPPYVRYQSMSNPSIRNSGTAKDIRALLHKAVERRVPNKERHIWQALVGAYSGLSDLSVPCWLLSAALVRPGGRLALVVPATWRSRQYADVLRYLMLRCFRTEVVVADKQQGWFSEALVRTHLIVARRLTPQESVVPLHSRSYDRETFPWVDVSPEAASGSGLVAAAFGFKDAEGQFADWISLQSDVASSANRVGLQRSEISLQDELAQVLVNADKNPRLRRLDPAPRTLSFFPSGESKRSNLLPAALGAIGVRGETTFTFLDELGIRVSQGLRTGCNPFFYVEYDAPAASEASVRVSSIFGAKRLRFPANVLRPVIHRQSDLAYLAFEALPPARLLDLRSVLLPEHLEAILSPGSGDMVAAQEVMSPDLSAYVRQAAATVYKGQLIPNLSAVSPNARPASASEGKPERYWYQLPDFTKRHYPDIFVARVNQDTPWFVRNPQTKFLVDANFSTLWSENGAWPNTALLSFLNSSWVQAFTECIGTPLGGGALKLEAAQLRRLLVPTLTGEAIDKLARIGQGFPTDREAASPLVTEIDTIVSAALLLNATAKCDIQYLSDKLRGLAQEMKEARQRGSP